MITKTTVDITVADETRNVAISYHRCEDGSIGNAPVYGVVGTIGRGSARYPTAVVLFSLAEGETPHRGNRVTTAADGSRWQYHMGTCIRNRQARIVGWADTAGITNSPNQARQDSMD